MPFLNLGINLELFIPKDLLNLFIAEKNYIILDEITMTRRKGKSQKRKKNKDGRKYQRNEAIFRIDYSNEFHKKKKPKRGK